MNQAADEKLWRTDGVEPTYAMEDELRPHRTVHGWLLGGVFEIETQADPPVVAWCRFVPARSTTGTPLVATFHLWETGYDDGLFRVWRPKDPRPDGHIPAEALDDQLTRRYIPLAERPSAENGRVGERKRDHVSPVIRALHEDSKARAAVRDGEYRRKREGDPLADTMDEISVLLWDHSEPEQQEDGREQLRMMLGEMPRERLTDIALRLAFDYIRAADDLMTLQMRLEEEED